ncbi:MAG TPA: ImmA/IrrE family metallo-endopeptidase [bacterium]|nr:ImmA/IrrE family metallo-endopeptidase [bacterium]
MLALTRAYPPVDIQTIIQRAAVPIVERALPDGVRGTIGHIAGQRCIILNLRWRFSSDQEKRWVLSEELGHVILGHQLVESTQPGAAQIGLREERRTIYEGEARAFAAELLMPLDEVRHRWFASRRNRFGPVREASQDELVRRLAEEFRVTPAAMRIRLADLRLIAK